MHRYRLRPGYGSRELLIELWPDRADEAFLKELFTALKQVNLKLTDVQDLWMNDEVLFNCDSDFGPFLISKDIWDSVFIMGAENQTAIIKTEEALRQSGRFRREIVDDSQYL